MLDIDFGDLGFDFSMSTGEIMEAFGSAGEATETRWWSRPVVREPHAAAYERALELADALPLDNETETFAFVSGNFVFGDLLEALVERRRLSVRSLGVHTLSLNDENIDSIRNVCEMMPVERLDLILSNYWYAHECGRGGLVEYLFGELDLEGLELRVAFAGTHCKVLTVETLRGNVLTMHGSANLRSSGNVEQLHISPDRGLYDFCEGMNESILDAYEVLNRDNRKWKRRTIRRSALWQAMTGAGAAPEAEAAGTQAAAAAGARRTAGASSPSATEAGEPLAEDRQAPTSTTTSRSE